MFDMVGAIAGTAVYAIMAGVLVGFSTASASRKLAARAAAAVWGGAVVATAALGGFAPGATGPVPALAFAFAGSLGLLLGGWLLLPDFRSALLAVPLPVLVALNAPRVGGVLFLMLAADGRLSAPFAPSAGWGDIITGSLAIPLAVMAWRAPERTTPPLALWNAFGALDLVAAIALGLLSAPGTPFRVFTEGPGTLAMGELPWVMVPAMLVPVFLLVHLTVAAKLRSSRRMIRAAVAAG
jgi:hypothetical protein